MLALWAGNSRISSITPYINPIQTAVQSEHNAAQEFDFDDWAKLARDNPAEFERRRRAAIDALIASAPQHRRRLEGTQWRIDRERELAHTPLKACLRISAMMWESFLEMKSALDEIATHVADAGSSRELVLVGTVGPPLASARGQTAVAGQIAPPSNVLPFARGAADERQD